VDRCIALLEHLRVMSESANTLIVLEQIKIRFIKPKFRTGQEVEALWNGNWHRVKILRQWDISSFEVRMLDGDPHARGEFKQIPSFNMRKIRMRIQSYRYINISRFENLGFKMNGNIVCSVDCDGYAARKGIVQGWKFVSYALKPSFLSLFWDFIQIKTTYPDWKKVDRNVKESLEDILLKKRVFTMCFFQPSVESIFARRTEIYKMGKEEKKKKPRRPNWKIDPRKPSFSFSVGESDQSDQDSVHDVKTTAAAVSIYNYLESPHVSRVSFDLFTEEENISVETSQSYLHNSIELLKYANNTD